jgi:hypothetical protein
MLDMLPVGAVPLRPAVQSWGMRGSLQTRRKGQVKPQPPPHLLRFRSIASCCCNLSPLAASTSPEDWARSSYCQY